MNTTMEAANVDIINSILGQRKDGFSVVFREIQKSTGPKDAYVIMAPTKSASPIVYADDVRTMNPTQIADYMEEVYKNSQLEFNEDEVMNASYILQHIMPHIAPAVKGDYLRKNGYSTIPFHNMIVTFAVEMKDGFFLLTDALMQRLGIRYEQIVEAALEHREQDYTIRKISDLLFDLGCGSANDEDGLPLYAITSGKSNGNFGASVILSHRILHETCVRIGVSKIALIPSSIHEFLAYPSILMSETNEVRNMIRDINESCVAPEDVLNDSLYIWDDDKQELFESE